MVSTHSRPKAAGADNLVFKVFINFVSTHSRPKAAGGRFSLLSYFFYLFQHTAARRRLGFFCACYGVCGCFNTQPPEGGWSSFSLPARGRRRFNTQPPEGGWVSCNIVIVDWYCFNTQPPEGGWILLGLGVSLVSYVSTHSRPKAAGKLQFQPNPINRVSTHSRPKAAG